MGDVHKFLIVDDEPLVQRALALALKRYGASTAASSVREAKTHLSQPWDGLLLDVRLGDGSGLDVLASVRRRNVGTPAVVLSGALTHDVVNRCAALDARLVMKPCGYEELSAFLAEVLLRKTNDRPYAAVERARHRWGLSEREGDILEHALRAKSRQQYMVSRGIAQNTYKTHVRKLLEKCDYANLSTLVIDLLAER